MIDDSVQGAHVLGLLTMGLRNMYSKKEIKSVADIKGEKIRVQATKTEDTHFPAYGAQTVHMPFGEVYTSLQTGVSDRRTRQRLHGEHITKWRGASMTEHRPTTTASVSDKTWKSLARRTAVVQEAADEVAGKEPPPGLPRTKPGDGRQGCRKRRQVDRNA
jgi:TRAP-type C4-dicarboxylate transport system substrate-binding protein